MDAKPKRPLSIWISQLFLLLYGVLFLALLGYRYVTEEQIEDLLLGTIAVVTLEVPFFAALIGLALRHQWGRWLSVVMFALIFGLIVYIYEVMLFDQAPEDLIIDRLGALLLVYFPCLILIPLLLFSRKVRAFFSHSEVGLDTQVIPQHLPPPPPTFDS